MLKLCVIVILTLSSLAFAGESGGGTSKPMASFGFENIKAISEDGQVVRLLFPNLEMTDINLVTQSGTVRTYRIKANNVLKSALCVFDVDVFNDHPTPVTQVHVVDLRVISGCASNTQASKSTLEVFPEYFGQFKNLTFDSDRKYSEYLKIASEFSPQKRKEIISYMGASDEKRFAQVLGKNADKFKAFIKSKPDVSTGEFYIFLGQVMGLDVSQGYVSAVVVGLELAPLYILKN